MNKIHTDKHQMTIDTSKSSILQNQPPQNHTVVMQDTPYGGKVILNFLDDDLEVQADFIPPIGAGSPLTTTMVHNLLTQQNIVYGIQEEAIQKAVETCTLSRQPVAKVLIARGVPPVNEVVEYFEINPHLLKPPQPVKPNGQIDYREQSPFIIVKNGQTLAQLRPKTEGKAGKDVHGKPIPYKTLRPAGVIGGDHTQTDEKFIRSEINGQFIRDKDLLQVQEYLSIKGGVGYATGNIIFPGDVIIDGPVSDGFKIYSEGSVTMKQTFDVTEVVTKKDLSVAGGIIGRGQAIVNVGGEIRTRFIENCSIVCRKTITVEREIINSQVFTTERINLGDKGFIVSGDIYAIHGIRAGKVGRTSGRPTKIHCGIDFIAQEESKKEKAQLQTLTAQIKKIREIMALPKAEANPKKQTKLEELLQRLEEAQRKAEVRVSDLMDQINADENATLEVYGEIAPGTLIEICQIALFVTKPLQKVSIKLDKFSGKLVPNPL